MAKEPSECHRPPSNPSHGGDLPQANRHQLSACVSTQYMYRATSELKLWTRLCKQEPLWPHGMSASALAGFDSKALQTSLSWQQLAHKASGPSSSLCNSSESSKLSIKIQHSTFTSDWNSCLQTPMVDPSATSPNPSRLRFAKITVGRVWNSPPRVQAETARISQKETQKLGRLCILIVELMTKVKGNQLRLPGTSNALWPFCLWSAKKELSSWFGLDQINVFPSKWYQRLACKSWCQFTTPTSLWSSSTSLWSSAAAFWSSATSLSSRTPRSLACLHCVNGFSDVASRHCGRQTTKARTLEQEGTLRAKR